MDSDKLQTVVVGTPDTVLAVELPVSVPDDELCEALWERLRYEYYGPGVDDFEIFEEQETAHAFNEHYVYYRHPGPAAYGEILRWTELARARRVLSSGALTGAVREQLEQAAEIWGLESLGIEGLCEGNGDPCDLWYINTGETYQDTIVYWEGSFWLCSWGDIVEHVEQRQARDV